MKENFEEIWKIILLHLPKNSILILVDVVEGREKISKLRVCILPVFLNCY